MDGTAELKQMAELLRVGIGAARMVAGLRSESDARRLETLAQHAEAMAAEVDAIVEGRPQQALPEIVVTH